MSNKVTEILHTKYPLIQAPMNWLTNAKLVAAVSNAGGLGVLGTNAGQTEITSDVVLTNKRMTEEIKKTKQLTDNPFGINILTPDKKKDNAYTNAILDAAFAAGLKYFVVMGTVNARIFRIIKEHGGVIIYRPLYPNIEELRRADMSGADILIAAGSDEGGFLPEKAYGTFTALPAMVDSVKTPVVAGGGINDIRGVKAAFDFGSQGVYLGTRFLVTKEAPTDERVKQLIINSNYTDTIEVSPTQRSLRTKLAEEFNKDYRTSIYTDHLNDAIEKSGGLLPAMLLGKIDEGIISVNSGIDLIKDEPTVAELIERLMK